MRLLIAAALLCCSTTAAAAGLYDGVYRALGTDIFLSIHQNGSAMMAAFLDTGEGVWDAAQGIITGNVATLDVIYTGEGSGDAEIRITFDSATAGELEILSCTADPGSTCEVTAGQGFQLRKVF